MSRAEAADFSLCREVVFLMTGTRARREATWERQHQLLEPVDWSALATQLEVEGLLPTLGPRVVAVAGERADEGFREALELALDAGRHRHAFLQLISTWVMNALAEAGIRATALKGPLLGEAIYGEPGRRLSSDIDVLVAPDDLAAAVSAVERLGYAKPIDHVERKGLPLLHFSLPHERGELPPVELHWRIHWYESAFAADRLLPPDAESSCEWRPGRADELASLLLYYARDGFTGLRHAADLGAWWDRFGAELGPGELTAVARAYPKLEPALVAASQVAASTIGLPREPVTRRDRLGARGRIAVRLGKNPHPFTDLHQLYAEIGLIDGLLSPLRDLGAFIRRQVAPPREVIRQHAEKDGRSRPNSTFGYSIRMLARYCLVLARLFRVPGEAWPATTAEREREPLLEAPGA